MKKSILCWFSVLMLGACQGIEMVDPEVSARVAACDVKNPPEQLSWLKEMLADNDPNSLYCSIVQVYQGEYEEHTVFVPMVSGALCCTCAGSVIYNCEGEVEFYCDPDKESKITHLQAIWKP